MTEKYLNSINKLIHLGNHNDKNNIIITDDYEKAFFNNRNDYLKSQLRVLNNIWTPKLNVSEIKTTYDCNVLKIGENDKIIHLVNKIGINETEPIVTLDINNSDGLKIPSGTVNERPTTLKKGIIRYNLELDQFEGYGAGNAWGSLGGVIDVNQDTFVRAEKTAGLDNNELEFYTSNIERMIIKNDGKVGIGTNTPNGIFEINNRLLVDDEKIQFKKDLIPNQNNTLNVGSSRYTISELFLSKDSLWIDDLDHLLIENSNLKFTKRKIDKVPDVILNLNGSEAGILTFTGKTTLNEINLTEWLDYGKTLDSSLTLKTIFNNEIDISSSVYTWIESSNNNIYFNPEYNNIGIGTDTPKVSLDINRTDAIKIPKGSTAERPTNLIQGYIRYNSELEQFEGYGAGNTWGSLGGVIDVNQDTFVRAEKTAGIDNNELEFYTSNIERMIIKDTGKVGINVSEPTHQLHVKGTTRIEGDLIVNGVQHIIDTDTTTTEQLKITNDGTGPALVLNQLGSEPVLDFQNNSNSVFFIKDGGNIGIKTNEPNISLHVNTTDGIIIPKGTTLERPTYLEKGIIRYNSELEQFEGYGAGNAWGSLGGVKDVDGDTYITAEKTPGLDNDELQFYTSNIERMIIKNDGKIGIGTSEPTESLEIIGNIKISGIIENDFFDTKYYSQDYININFLNLNYNLNRVNYNSDKDNSIVGFYKFDNDYFIGEDSSTQKNDLINIGSNLTLNNNIKISGKNSIFFESDNQYLQTIKNIDLYNYWNENNGFSISFWTNITDITENLIFLGSEYTKFVIYYNDKVNIRVNGNLLTQNLDITINQNQWTHHLFVFTKNENNNTNVYYYKNNVKYVIAEDIEILIVPSLNSKFNFGHINNTNAFIGTTFKGYLDDIRFFNKNLTDSEVSNTFYDKSIYVRPYTLQSLGQLEMNSNKIPIFLNETVSGTVDFLNESNLESDSINAIATQHSVKTYIDTTSSNLYELLRLKPGTITNELLAGDITDDKLLERYVKTSDLINMQTHTTDILQIENGGTGASNILDARSNLGLSIDIDVQAYNSRLQSISDQPGSFNKIPIFVNNNEFKYIDFIDDDDMALNSCNAIPTQKNIKTYIENFINNFGTDVLKIGIQTLDISDIDTGITTKFNNCEFYLTLYIDYYLIGASITQQYRSFIDNLCNSLGILLNIPKEDISVEDLYSGSIIFKIKVKSTDSRNSAINIYNTYLNYDNLILECNLDLDLFSNSYINIDENISNQAFELDKNIVYITLDSDKEYTININDIVSTPYLIYELESNIYDSIIYNALQNTLTFTGDYRNTTYDVFLNINKLDISETMTLRVTEIAPIIDAYVSSNMTIYIGNDTKQINLKDKFIGPRFNLIQLVQTSEFNNVTYINNNLYEITGNFRNTTYDIVWSGTQLNDTLLEGQENKTLEWKLTVIELPSIPSKIFSDIDNINISQFKTYNLTAIFNGPDLIYTLLKNPYNSAEISGELLIIEPNERGISYELIVEAKNLSKRINWKLNVTENLPVTPTLLIDDLNINLADEHYSVDLTTVFSGKHVNYNYNVLYNHILNSNILPNIDYFESNIPYARYHSKNFNKYENVVYNLGKANQFNLELLEGNVYESFDNNVSYIYGDKDTVMRFKMPNTTNYTICALLKYNGNNRGTILGTDTSFIGHWNDIKGFVNINSINVTSITGLPDKDDWLIVLYNNNETAPNNVQFYPSNSDVLSTKTTNIIFDYLYINKQKNSDWALADIVVFDKELTVEDNNIIVDIFKDYLLNVNNNLQNDLKLKDISVFLNNFSLDENSNLVIIDANNIGISYNILLTATNVSGNIDWNLTVNEAELLNKNTDITLTSGLYEFGLNYIFNDFNFNTNISINNSNIFDIENNKLLLYPKYREIAYIIELNNGTNNFVLEVKELEKQKPKLLNENYYLINENTNYYSNIIDNIDNQNTILDINTSNNNFYLTGIGIDFNYINQDSTNITIDIEKSSIIEMNVTSYGNHPFTIVKSDTNPERINSDSNRYINSGLVYTGYYEIAYGLITGKVTWDTSTSDVGKYYALSIYDSDVYFIINIIDKIDQGIEYLINLNTLKVNPITDNYKDFKILANNTYGTSILNVKLIKDTIENNILTDNIINISISENFNINLFNYKYANNYSILNNPDSINININNNILSIQYTNNGIYELLIKMDDYIYVFKITEI
jgi:hypothetical protein